MTYLYIDNFMYICTFITGETDILKKEYYILEYKDVLFHQHFGETAPVIFLRLR